MGIEDPPPKKKTNQGKDFPRLVALPAPRQQNRGRLFSGFRNHWKQAGLTLSGRGILA